MIRIAIADDQVLLRDMMRAMLVSDPEIEVVGCASEGSELIRICLENLPDIALVDICMPGTDGIQVLKALKKQAPQIKVIMLTTFEDENNIIEAYQSGTDGYILKDIRPQALVLTVKCIYEGLFVMHKKMFINC
ncbi:MAG TPA: response regulator transcription factor [Bacillota bacterium]|nr:response regulator transcription factor [Bacillota bacterium]